MSELQSFFEPSDQSQTRDDLPARLAVAARGGDLDRVRRWLAAGGSPDASTERDGKTLSLLEFACASGRPANAEIVADVRAAGSFKRYANAPRLDVVVLQALCAKGRATPPPILARLFPTSTKSPHLPKEIFWRILSYWRTDRDP